MPLLFSYRVIVTGVLADRFPAELHLFRTYHPTLDKPVKTTGNNASFEEIKAPNGRAYFLLKIVKVILVRIYTERRGCNYIEVVLLCIIFSQIYMLRPFFFLSQLNINIV